MLKALLAALGAGAACFLFFYAQGEEVPVLVHHGLYTAGAVFLLSLLLLIAGRILRSRTQQNRSIPSDPFQPPEIITLRSKTPEELEAYRRPPSPPKQRSNLFRTRH